MANDRELDAVQAELVRAKETLVGALYLCAQYVEQRAGVDPTAAELAKLVAAAEKENTAAILEGGFVLE